MLRINRVKVDIFTENGIYGTDIDFNSGLTFLSSEDNTCGKSSILAAVYYCLGLEEIIGGKGDKVLTSVYKTTIEYGDQVWNVLQSAMYLEISNGADIVTLFRAAKMHGRDSRMITIYHSALDDITKPETLYFDTYVHMPNSAINTQGFHSFLEKFLFLELPQVSTSDDSQRKLYLQLVFSCMFIEQKHGWSDLFSGMPILGIKESKKRVIEYVLKLDTLENDKKKEQLKQDETLITKEWFECYNSLQIAANRESCSVLNYPLNPKILTDKDINQIIIRNRDGTIDDVISSLAEQTQKLNKLKPKVIDNFDALQSELNEIEDSIANLKKHVLACRNQVVIEKETIKTLRTNLETIAIDISNNKDAARLRNLGSDLHLSFQKDICPVCHQKINDSLLPTEIDAYVMNIDENIKHLEAQQEMMRFALSSHIKHKDELDKEIQTTDGKLFTLRRLAQSIRSDLYSTNDNYSEAVVYKKITLQKQIEALENLQHLQKETEVKLKELSKKWANHLNEKNSVPKSKFTALDKEKLNLLRTNFINNLKSYGYKSIPNLNEVTISEESYLPLFEGFDMKFDSSASDNIRVIWAFTVALLQVSLEKDGNHPTVLIFDEPDQQSTIISDMQSFFTSILEITDKCQVIMGITLKDSDTKKLINELPEGKYKQVNIPYKAFQLIQTIPKS